MTINPNQPFPAPGDDPYTTAAMERQNEYEEYAKQTRFNASLSDLQVAQAITTTWTNTNAELARLYQQLQAARRARIDVLEKVVPLGPGIPTDTSPADTAVMNQAFRSALERARNAKRPDTSLTVSSSTPTGYDTDTLAGMFADAEKFDDDTLRRAVLTVAVETGQTQLIRAWTDKMGVSDQLDELTRLSDAVSGHGFDNMWDYRAFKPINKPTEAWNLPSLEAAAQATNQARVTQARGY